MYVRRDGSKFLRPLNVLAFLIVLPQLCSTSHDDLLFNNTAVYRVEFVLDQQDIHAVFIDLRLLTGSFQLKARHDNYWYSKNHCPRRPVSIWQKHGYVCLFLPADDLTICMDILPNPGPVSPISSPRNDSVYKLGGKNLHVRPNHIQYSRSALLKLRPCGNHVSNLGWNTLSNLKETSLLKYRGYRAGGDRNSVNNFAINSALKSQLFRSTIPVVSSRRVAFKRNSFEYRPKSLITIDCKTNNSVVQSLQTTGTGKVISRKPASFALINAQSIRNKTLPLKIMWLNITWIFWP